MGYHGGDMCPLIPFLRQGLPQAAAGRELHSEKAASGGLNARGSVDRRLRIDGTSACVVSEEDWPQDAAFGETLDQRGSLVSAKGFTNHEQTDPSGLIYMQARFYLPQYHRFSSPDPARDQHFEETQSWNIYSYVQNNPLTHRVPPVGVRDRAS